MIWWVSKGNFLKKKKKEKSRKKNFKANQDQEHFTARKAEIMLSLLEVIESPITELLEATSHSSEVCLRYLRELERQKLYPWTNLRQHQSISVICDSVLAWDKVNPARITTWKSLCKENNIKKMLQEGIAAIEGIGLCLDCVKTDGKSAREGQCRINHPNVGKSADTDWKCFL